MEVQPPFGAAKKPAQASANVPYLLQQTSKAAVDIESIKLVETSGGSEPQQGQQVVTERPPLDPSRPIARSELLLGHWLTKLCMQL